MGQAAVDLPDPLDTPPRADASAGAAGTDELLSQLAGEEIDRLLADADVDRDSVNGPPSSAPDGPTPQVTASETTADRADRASGAPAASDPPADPNADLLPDVPGLDPAPAGGAAGGDASAATVPVESTGHRAAGAPSPGAPLIGANIPAGPETSATEEAALAELFDQLTGGIGGAKSAPHDHRDDIAAQHAPTTTGEVPLGTPPSQPSTAEQSSDVPTGTAGLDAFEMTAAERAALEAPLPLTEDALDPQPGVGEAPLDAAAVEQPGAAPDESGEPAPIFQYEGALLYVRVLEWVNAPLDALPDGARDAVGKVAVMTLVNAVAILVYVLFFRH